MIDIVTDLSNGLTAKEIAAKINLSNRTVEAMISKLLYKYSAKTRTQLVAIFIREQVIL